MENESHLNLLLFFKARLQWIGYAFLAPGAKNKVVIKRPILASRAAAPVTHGGLRSLGFDWLCFAAGEYACLSYKSF